MIENIDFSLRHCLNETMKLIEPRVRVKGLNLRTQVDEAVPDSLCGDARRVRQVLFNLLGNAIKFTQRGVIDVSVESIAIDAESAWLHFTVRDTGAGIPPDRQSQIFEAFAQADNSSTREFGGIGLGLTICSRLAAAMGGRIAVESTPGEGSTFHFSICAGFGACVQPEAGVLSTIDSETSLQRPIAEPVKREPLDLLLAEDNIVNRSRSSSSLCAGMAYRSQ